MYEIYIYQLISDKLDVLRDCICSAIYLYLMPILIVEENIVDRGIFCVKVFHAYSPGLYTFYVFLCVKVLQLGSVQVYFSCAASRLSNSTHRF